MNRILKHLHPDEYPAITHWDCMVGWCDRLKPGCVASFVLTTLTNLRDNLVWNQQPGDWFPVYELLEQIPDASRTHSWMLRVEDDVATVEITRHEWPLPEGQYHWVSPDRSHMFERLPGAKHLTKKKNIL